MPKGLPALNTLWRLVREKWIAGLATLAVGVSFTVIGASGRMLVYRWQDFVAERTNISTEQALSIARERLGPVAVAIPFRNRGSATQFILAAISTGIVDREDAPRLKLMLLRGGSTVYEAIDPNMSAGDEFSSVRPSPDLYYHKVLGVVDITEHGNKQVFGIFRDGGTGAYGFTVDVFDPITHTSYGVHGGGLLGEPGRIADELQFSENVGQMERLRQWLDHTAQGLVLTEKAESAYDREVTAYLQKYGRGFHAGDLAGGEYQGKIPLAPHPPRAPTVYCRVADDWFEWVAFWRGDLFGFDKHRHVHFVVYVPANHKLNWIDFFVSGKDYLWLPLTTFVINKGDVIIAFKKVTRTFVEMSVDRLVEQDSAGESHRLCDDIEPATCLLDQHVFRVSNGKLMVNELVLNQKLVDIGGVAPDEFAQARTCP